MWTPHPHPYTQPGDVDTPRTTPQPPNSRYMCTPDPQAAQSHTGRKCGHPIHTPHSTPRKHESRTPNPHAALPRTDRKCGHLPHPLPAGPQERESGKPNPQAGSSHVGRDVDTPPTRPQPSAPAEVANCQSTGRATTRQHHVDASPTRPGHPREQEVWTPHHHEASPRAGGRVWTPHPPLLGGGCAYLAHMVSARGTSDLWMAGLQGVGDLSGGRCGWLVHIVGWCPPVGARAGCWVGGEQ